MIKVSKDIIEKVYPARPLEVKKYDYGLLLVIGGGEFYSGSPALSALSGFRAGADMVRLIAPKRAADIIASFSPILAAFPLDNTHLLKQHLPILLTMTESAKESAHGKVAVIIGGGMGRSQETQETIVEYLSQINVPVVIDADAIHSIAERLDVLAGKPFLVTPNMFELTLLGGKDVRPLEMDQRIQEVQEIASKLHTTLLLKAKTDIIANGTDVALNETGSPCMSIGGAGDTLAGIAGALLARGVDAFTAAQAAAFINGKAGEAAAKIYKESLVATDLIDAIKDVIG